MSERAAFINAILDNPTDDTARLVFADWLEEHGEPERAEFIRAQIELAKRPERDRGALAARAAALLRDHEGRWREAVGIPQGSGRYARGFLAGERLSSVAFAARTAGLAHEPMSIVLDLHGRDANEEPLPDEHIAELARSPALRAVAVLNSSAGAFGERFPLLLRSPFLTNLTGVLVREDQFGSAGVVALAASPSPFVLADIDLNGALADAFADEESDDAVEAVALLATAPRFASLTSLALPFNALGDRSIEALLASRTLRPDLRLDLTENIYDRAKYDAALGARFVYDADW